MHVWRFMKSIEVIHVKNQRKTNLNEFFSSKQISRINFVSFFSWNQCSEVSFKIPIQFLHYLFSCHFSWKHCISIVFIGNIAVKKLRFDFSDPTEQVGLIGKFVWFFTKIFKTEITLKVYIQFEYYFFMWKQQIELQDHFYVKTLHRN